MKKYNKKLQGKSKDQNPKDLREEEVRLRQGLIDEKDKADNKLISSEAFLKKLDDFEDKYQGYETYDSKMDSLQEKLDKLWKKDDKDLEDLEEINRIIDEQNNIENAYSDLIGAVHSSDENFLEFADLCLAREEVEETEFVDAPDELKERVLGKQEKRGPAKVGIMEKFEWILRPRVAAISFVSAALLFFLLMPVLKDENIDDIIFPNEFLPNEVENSEIPILKARGKLPTEIELLKDADADGIGENPQKNVLGYPPITSPPIKPNIIKVEEVVYRGPIISDDKLVSVLIVDGDLLIISQKDDLERTVKIFQNDEDILKPKEELISTKYFSHYTKLSDNNDNFSELYSSQWLKDNGVYENYLISEMEKGFYRVEVSIFGKVLLNESITIE